MSKRNVKKNYIFKKESVLANEKIFLFAVGMDTILSFYFYHALNGIKKIASEWT